MSGYPFSIRIEPDTPDGEAEEVVCLGMLRGLANKRGVYDGRWKDRAVIVKVFSDVLKARLHMMREWRGLRILQSRGLNSPKPLLRGKSSEHGWVTVAEKISGSETARALWDNAANVEEKSKILTGIAGQLARQHDAGVVQKDLHLSNFLIRGQEVFALDPAQMRFLCRQVGKKRSITQLALLASVAPRKDTSIVEAVSDEYARTRGWEFHERDRDLFYRKLTQCRRRGIERALKKCLRTNKRHKRIEPRGRRGVAERRFYETVDFGELLQGIDRMMEAGRILKRGNTSFVSRVNLAGRDVVIKRYNNKGLIHSLRHTIKGSRAKRCWLNANRLLMLKVATPKPLAYIERRKGPIVWLTYFLSEYVPGPKLSDVLASDKLAEQDRLNAVAKVEQVIAKLSASRITHGDLKH